MTSNGFLYRSPVSWYGDLGYQSYMNGLFYPFIILSHCVIRNCVMLPVKVAV